MDILKTIQLLAFVLQFIGIMVGAGLIFERVIKAVPLKALFIILNTVQKIILRRPWHLYKISDNIDELYKEANRPILIFLPLITVTIGILSSVGLWLWLFYRLYQFYACGISIGGWFWVGFSAWLFMLAVNHLLSLPAQLALISRKLGRAPSFSDGLVQFLKNWYVYPLELVRIEVLLSVVIVLLLPAWIFRVHISSEKPRQRYYFAYATVTLLLSTLIKIILIVI